MKYRLCLLSLILGLAVTPALLAQDTAPTAGAGAAMKDDSTPLGDEMNKLGRAFRKLRKLLPDPTKNPDSLAQVAIIREAAQESAKLTPAKTADLPEVDWAKFEAEFQSEIKKFLGLVDSLEAALKANDNTGAQKFFDEMAQEQKDAHKQFRKPKK
jgi:cytochrome c556